MKTTKLITRKYRDGVMNVHSNRELEITTAAIYTLYRVEGEETDWHMMPTTYSIVCDYGNGHTNLHSFESIESAFCCFRLMIGLDLIV